MALLVKDEVYDDGSEYFEWADGSYEHYSPEGYLTDSYYPPNAPSDHPGSSLGDAIAGFIRSITGQPNYSQAVYRQQSGFVPTSNTPIGRCNGIQLGGSIGPSGGVQGGLCLSPIMLAIGGLVAGAFFFGKKGR